MKLLNLLNPWLREKKTEERVRLGALMDGLTDGHTYSRRTAEPKYPRDGMLMHFAAGVVGNEEGFYVRLRGQWWYLLAITADPPEPFTTCMLKGLRGNQPSASLCPRVYWVDDEGVLERDSGNTWEQFGFVNDPANGRSIVHSDHFAGFPFQDLELGEAEYTLVSLTYVAHRSDDEGVPTAAVEVLDSPNGVLHLNTDNDAVVAFATRCPVTSAAKDPAVWMRVGNYTHQTATEVVFGLFPVGQALTALPSSGIYVRSVVTSDPMDVQTTQFVCETADEESTVVLAHPNSALMDYVIVVRNEGTVADIYVNGSLIGSLTTNIPSDNLCWGIRAAQVNVGYDPDDCQIDIDFVYVSSETL